MDVNDVFENLFLAEEVAEQKGYKEGFETGKNRLFEGYHLGYHRASSIGAQLGYYSGTLLLYQNHPREKVSTSANNLLQEINQFPKTNDDKTDINGLFQKIKFKFNKFCTLVKVSSSYPEADKLEF